jgi:hypothetical protein
MLALTFAPSFQGHRSCDVGRFVNILLTADFGIFDVESMVGVRIRSNGMAASLAYIYSTDPQCIDRFFGVAVEISACSRSLGRLPADWFT